MFWNSSWSAVRIAGSGTMHYPSADILATNKKRLLAIECKSSRKNTKYIEKEDIEQLKKFSFLFNARPFIGIRFRNSDWFFLNPNQLKEKQKSFIVSLDFAKEEGITFEELIQ